MNVVGETSKSAGFGVLGVSDITSRVVDFVAEGAASDGWCSRNQVTALATQRGIDRMELQRALQRATDDGRLEREGDRYRAV